MGKQVRLEVVRVGIRLVEVLVDLDGHQHRRSVQVLIAAANEAHVGRSRVQLGHLRVGIHRTDGQVLAHHFLAVDVGDHALTTEHAQLEAVVAVPHRRNRHRQSVVPGVRAHLREAARRIGGPRRIDRMVPVRCGLRRVRVSPGVRGRDCVGRVEKNLSTALAFQTTVQDIDLVHLNVEVGSVIPSRR